MASHDSDSDHLVDCSTESPVRESDARAVHHEDVLIFAVCLAVVYAMDDMASCFCGILGQVSQLLVSYLGG